MLEHIDVANFWLSPIPIADIRFEGTDLLLFDDYISP